MFPKLVKLLNDQPALVLFLVLGLGHLIGKLRIKGFVLGSTAGVLFAGLLFGHFGFKIAPLLQTFGFILFIYSVGYRVGPQFFRIPRKQGLRFMFLAIVVAGAGFLTAGLLASLFGFEKGISAGLMAGALTSTPTLAAAQDLVRGGLLAIPEGLTEETVLINISTTYAITYVFGMAGLMVFIRLFPRWVGIDLAEEARKVAHELQAPASDEGSGFSQFPLRARRVFQVTNPETMGKTLKELENVPDNYFLVKRVKRKGTVYIPQQYDALEADDLVLVTGPIDTVLRLYEVIGPEVGDEDLLRFEGETAELAVTRPDVIGKKIQDLDLQASRGLELQRYTRMGVEIPVSREMTIEKGDVVRVHGNSEDVDALAKQIGHAERNFDQTDLLTFSFGIVAGILIGTFAVNVWGVSIGLGMAGGLLLTGLVVGHLRSLSPTFGRVPPAARWIFMELGLMLFMAGVGLNAGGGIVEALLDVGPSVFLCGVAVTLVPVVAGYVFGTRVLKENPALLFGGITGALTSTPALNIVSAEAKSPLPALGYTAAYAFANVLLTIAGSLIIRL